MQSHPLPPSLYLIQRDIDPCMTNACVCSRFYGLQERIKLRIEVDRPRAVDDAPLHLRTEVHLHNVPVLKMHTFTKWKQGSEVRGEDAPID